MILKFLLNTPRLIGECPRDSSCLELGSGGLLFLLCLFLSLEAFECWMVESTTYAAFVCEPTRGLLLASALRPKKENCYIGITG